jgi:hypothetical protein
MLNHAYLVEPLKRLGHTVFSVGCTPTMLSDPFNLHLPNPPVLSLDELSRYLPAHFTPDVIVYNDSSEFPRILGLDKARVPTVFFSIDAHVHASWHKFFGGAFDLVLLAQPDYLGQFQAVNPSTTWFPLWADTWTDPGSYRPIDVSFRGSFSETTQPERIKFFDRLSKLMAGDFGGGSYAEVYAQSKIVINHVWKEDVNFRVFEGIGCGALMVTPRVGNGLFELFKDGDDIITYENGNAEDAARKIRMFLGNQDELKRIAQNGYAKVRSQHSDLQRAKALADMLLNLSSRRDVKKHLNVAVAYLHNVRAIPERMGDIRTRLITGCVEALFEYIQAGGERGETFAAVTSVTCDKLRDAGQEELARNLIKFAQ